MTKFKTGDKVKLLKGGDIYPLFGFHNGEVYEITAMPNEHTSHERQNLIQIEDEDRFCRGYARANQLELVDQPKQNPFKVGDTVKVISHAGTITFDAEIGQIGIVDGYSDARPETRVHVKFDDYSQFIDNVDLQLVVEPTFTVGDRAKVVSDKGPWHCFRVGDVVEIVEVDSSGHRQSLRGKRTTDGLIQWFAVEQLERVTVEEPGSEPSEIDFLIREVADLQKRVATLEARLPENQPCEDIASYEMETPSITEPHPQDRRDQIVEEAKKDVVDLQKRMSGDIQSIGNRTFMYKITKAEFIVNKEKRTVVALVKGAHKPILYEKGIAKCTSDDVFNVHIGKAIALRRALGLDVPSEYLNAPKPSQVRVGDIVQGTISGRTFTVEEWDGYKAYGTYNEDGEDAFVPPCHFRIIDDSRLDD